MGDSIYATWLRESGFGQLLAPWERVENPHGSAIEDMREYLRIFPYLIVFLQVDLVEFQKCLVVIDEKRYVWARFGSAIGELPSEFIELYYPD